MHVIKHHMDAFACSGAPTDYTGMSHCTNTFDVSECGPWVAVYDKGAGDYRLPDDVGLAIGEGTGFTWILLQTHYLMTEEPKDLSTLSSIGNSGFKLWLQVGGTQRTNNARFLGIIDMTMDVPKDAAEHAYSVPAQTLQSFIQHDLDRFGNVTVFAGRLHAHDHCDGLYVDVRRQDPDTPTPSPWDAVAALAPYGVCNNNQTVQDFGPTSAVGPGVALRGGEELRVRCTWRAPHPRLPYGTDLGQEMCGAMLLYHPTDAAAAQDKMAYEGPGYGGAAAARGTATTPQLLRTARHTEKY